MTWAILQQSRKQLLQLLSLFTSSHCRRLSLAINTESGIGAVQTAAEKKKITVNQPPALPLWGNVYVCACVCA